MYTQFEVTIKSVDMEQLFSLVEHGFDPHVRCLEQLVVVHNGSRDCALHSPTRTPLLLVSLSLSFFMPR